MNLFRLFLSGLTCLAAAPIPVAADEGHRILVVRERATASLINDTFTFRVMKLKGYSVDIMLAGKKRTLKLGDGFGPADSACAVIFEEVSPETRIARFKTNCPDRH